MLNEAYVIFLRILNVVSIDNEKYELGSVYSQLV